MLNRRALLAGSCAGLLATLGASRLAFAQAPGPGRLVFVFLRGGLDGLHALVPYADPALRVLRPDLIPEGRPDLDGYFGLHPSLAPLMDLWRAGELALIPASATRYRERSHFEGQALLENGTASPNGARDGWLNRAILALNGGDARLGLSLGPSVPLILQGAAPVVTWSNEGLPDLDADFLTRLGIVYRADPAFDAAFRAAQGAPQPDRAMLEGVDDNFLMGAQVAGDLLSRDNGPRIAAFEMQGWDTHVNQSHRLNGLLARLAEGVLVLRRALGAAWGQSVVILASEFGRTAAQNGAGGTDHGTGGVLMLAGGALRGGRILGDWPGLTGAALFEGRDLLAVNAYEAVFKAVLEQHMGLDRAVIEERVFPESRLIRPLDGLL